MELELDRASERGSEVALRIPTGSEQNNRLLKNLGTFYDDDDDYKTKCVQLFSSAQQAPCAGSGELGGGGGGSVIVIALLLMV